MDLCFGRVDEFTNVGDYRVCEIDRAPPIVVRRVSGIAAMSAVCRHRLSVIAEGGRADGVTRAPTTGGPTIRGPADHSATHAGGFRPQGDQPAIVPGRDPGGFVYVNLDAHATFYASDSSRSEELLALLPHRAHAHAHASAIRLADQLEGAGRELLEPYHLNVTHRGTLATFYSEGVAVLPHAAFHSIASVRSTQHRRCH